MILQSISSDIVLPRSIRREMARQLEKKDWAKRDKLAVERLKIRVSAANIH